MLCATTNQKNGFVLRIAHGLFPLDRLYALTETTVTAYTLAIVIGTRMSRTELKIELGIVKGGAKRVEPAGGEGRVRGSLLGGNWKRSELGTENWTIGEDIFTQRLRV